jgi:hypothetical protein
MSSLTTDTRVVVLSQATLVNIQDSKCTNTKTRVRLRATAGARYQDKTFCKCVKMTGSSKSFSVVQEMLYLTVDFPVATYVAALYVQ